MNVQHSKLAARMVHNSLTTIAKCMRQHNSPEAVTKANTLASVERFAVRTFHEAQAALGY
ncbi:MAG: hypothetical protein NXH95_14390 [Pseudomonadaceae bacterium]|nr:hypothetical protein [Pseudomonadaceae bacterium]